MGVNLRTVSSLGVAAPSFCKNVAVLRTRHSAWLPPRGRKDAYNNVPNLYGGIPNNLRFKIIPDGDPTIKMIFIR